MARYVRHARVSSDFLITGAPIGKGTWKKPVDSSVTKGVPKEDADYEY